jgi:two-component system nitrogen regulation response regulator GlnG
VNRKDKQPLANAVLSRKPIFFYSPSEQTVRIDVKQTNTEVVVNGKRLTSEHEFHLEEIDSGIVIELSKRVVLLLHHMFSQEPDDDDLGIIGHSGAIHLLRNEIRRVADLNVPVLLRGETGAGKELAARAISRLSHRRDKPYIAVNMAAIPGAIAAAELFGHAKGAFTDADNARKGYFERANGGTLFLDEIGDTSLEVQAMLLRVIEDQTIQTIGSETTRKVDVRVVAATDADLEAAVERERFREALKQRLQEYEIYIPPLRVRREDIGELFIHFIREQLDDIGELNRLAEPLAGAPTWLPASFVARLITADWPGNVRQLRTLARRIAIANRGELSFCTNQAVDRLFDEAGVPSEIGGQRWPSTRLPKPSPLNITEAQLREALRRNRYRARAAAEDLGIGATSIYTLIERYGIQTSKSLTFEQIKEAISASQGNLDLAADRLEVPIRGLKLRIKELESGHQ